MLTTIGILKIVAENWAPPPKMSVSEWADGTRRLSSEASAIPGQWKTSIVEYMREPMDMIGDPRVRQVVVMACAQVAKSEFVLNVCGYLIDYDPSPILLIQPTLEMAEDFSKDRVGPMLRDTPALRMKVSDSKSRTADNTIKKKKFRGGHLTMIGANAPAGLSSRPIRAVLCDEVDRYPEEAGKEGDPINLAIKRTATFWNRIILLVSTPTEKGASRVEKAYDGGDRRQWKVPCPHCGVFDILKWSNVRWEKDRPETVRYVCEHCEGEWTDPQRIVAVRKGYWEAREEFEGIASFHITGLMSPFTTMADGVREFLEAKSDPRLLKVWVNTYLGETWEEKGERLDTHALEERAEAFEGKIPDEVTLMTAGVDVQDDRVELEVVGWGNDHESWSIDWEVIYGDPTTKAVWSELTSKLRRIYDHPRFGQMQIRATCIDTGHHTAKVYDYVKSTDRVYGIKGVGGEGTPLVGRPGKNNYGKIPLFPVGTNTAKDLVFSRLRSKEGEAGRCHFPEGRATEYFDQLTAEKKVTRFRKGFKHFEYVKMRARNEALDLRVYATAALELLSVDLRAQRAAKELQWYRSQNEDGQTAKSKVSSPKSRSFVNDWKNR